MTVAAAVAASTYIGAGEGGLMIRRQSNGKMMRTERMEVDEIGRAMGVTYQDGEPLRAGPKEAERDRHRWELDPASAEDYRDRMVSTAEAEPILRMCHKDRYARSS
jgi:hypothetical protein